MIKRKINVGIDVMPIIFKAEPLSMTKFITSVTAGVGTADGRRTNVKLFLYIED